MGSRLGTTRTILILKELLIVDRRLRAINEAWAVVISYVSTSIEHAKATQEEHDVDEKKNILEQLTASAFGPSSKHTLSDREAVRV